MALTFGLKLAERQTNKYWGRRAIKQREMPRGGSGGHCRWKMHGKCMHMQMNN